MDDALGLLRTAYGDLAALLADLDGDEAVRPTGCAGWAVLDLARHLVLDVRRGLVATAAADGAQLRAGAPLTAAARSRRARTAAAGSSAP